MTRSFLSVIGLAACTLAACADRSPTDTVTALEVRPQADARNSEQVIFSGEGDGSLGEVGFWIWCEAESNNKYEEECNGAIRFDDLGLTRHVEGDVEETAEGIYEATVASTRDNTVACVVANVAEAVHGPHNTVTVTCTLPSGTATSTNAVVNVTGP